METVVIFNNFDNGPMTSIVMDGDFQHLHEKYINSCDCSESEFDEINDLAKAACIKGGVGEWYTHNLPTFPNDEFYDAVKNGAKVIITGCLP